MDNVNDLKKFEMVLLDFTDDHWWANPVTDTVTPLHYDTFERAGAVLDFNNEQ